MRQAAAKPGERPYLIAPVGINRNVLLQNCRARSRLKMVAGEDLIFISNIRCAYRSSRPAQAIVSANSGHQKLHRTSAKTLRPDSTPVAPSCSGAAVVPNSRWCG
jgi:hypothetical protein